MTKPILIVVDDKLEFSDVVKEVAEKVGYEVLIANHADEFQVLWQTNHPVAIVIGAFMPEMNGNPLLNWLAKKGCYDPVLLITDAGDEAIEMVQMTRSITHTNIIGVMTSPIAKDTLEELLKKAIQKLILMEGTDVISVGVSVIDRDHQKLFSLLNEMEYIFRAEVASKKGAIQSVLSELIDYTKYHFKREEILMEACDYPELENHKQVHEVLKEQVKHYLEGYRRDPSSFDLEKLRNFLKDWLIDHIMVMDKRYESWMQNKEDIIGKTNTEFEQRIMAV